MGTEVLGHFGVCIMLHHFPVPHEDMQVVRLELTVLQLDSGFCVFLFGNELCADPVVPVVPVCHAISDDKGINAYLEEDRQVG